MIKAVLLDLDNTLLQNNDESFAAAYLHLVDDYLRQRWKHTEMSSVFLTAVRALAQMHDMEQTNSSLMFSVLCRQTGIPIPEIQAALADFHHTAYPLLQSQTQAVPDAATLVQYLRDQQYAVAIVTNPIYPAEAIQQRLVWAGLSGNFDDYALVTNADIMRFTKANPAFYVEVVARIGIEPDEAIMVGDSLKRDVRPAKQVGLHTYHILPDARNGNNGPPADAAGTLADFYLNVKQHNWLDNLLPRPLSPQMIEPEMLGNLAALFGTLDEAKPRYWQQHPDPGEWSPIQIVCHLLDSEVGIHRARLKRILAEDNPFLVDLPARSSARETPVCDDDGKAAARRFTTERLETLEWLRQLRPEDWHRPARHSIFGLTTLLEMAHFTAQHDRLHINQLCQTLGRCQ